MMRDADIKELQNIVSEFIAWVDRAMDESDEELSYLNGGDRKDGDGWTDVIEIADRARRLIQKQEK
jgi:hypothetical protein